MNDKHWMIWDGECGLCSSTAQWVRRRDRSRKFQIVSNAGCPRPPMTDEILALTGSTVVVVTAKGEILTRSQAMMFILAETGWGWFARLLGAPPLVWILNVGYGIVARNRGWISKKFFGGAVCGLDNRYPEVDAPTEQPPVKTT